MEKNVNAIDLSNKIKNRFESDDNIISKQINNGKIIVMYVDGICDSVKVTEYVVFPLQVQKLQNISIDSVLSIIEHPDCKIIESIEASSELVAGKCIVLLDNIDTCISIGLDVSKERNISEPPTSAVLKGPREGFVENYKTNIALLRKILATSDFGVEYLNVGKYTNTNVCIVYLGGVCDKKLVHTIKEKIK
ncbi:MAG: spore germination protein, partial [Clostridia bacterium]|nr:spore germination protein [Clostridia bacterium]